MPKKFVKNIFIFLIISLLTLFSVQNTIRAQEFNSEKAYSDYVFTRSNYDMAYRNYETAKESYQKNPTLTLKEEARIATVEMLKFRDDLYRVYLTAIRTKIGEIKGLTNDEKGNLFTKLDSEVLYYQGHRLTYTGNEPLAEVFKINTDVENHYKSVTLPFIYESLFMISYGQEVGIRQENQIIYQSLIDLLNRKIAEGVLIVDPFNRWILDVTGLIETLQKRENLAKTQIQDLYTKKTTNITPLYQKAVNTLEQTVPELTRLNKFVTEFATAIDNQI